MTLARSKPSETSKSATRRRLEVSPWIVGILVSLGHLAWRFRVLDQVPVWDGAMGMTPAAITLESLDFDIAALLDMPDYRAGGPNLHSLSIATWIVAASIRVFGSYLAALPFLHLISFALAGILAAGVYRIILRFGKNTALALTGSAASVLFPAMVVQASDVYLDLPLAVAVTWTFVYLFERRYVATLIVATLAAAIKPSMVIAVPAMALYLIRERQLTLKRSIILLVPTITAVAPLLTDTALQPRGDVGIASATDAFTVTGIFLANMPEIVVLLPLLIVVALVLGLRDREVEMKGETDSVILTAVVLPISFLTFFLLNPLVTKGVVGLPRYTTLFVPLMIAGLLLGVARLESAKVSIGLVVLILVFSVANMHGALQPSSRNLYPLSERTLEYEDHLAVQREAFTAFAELARETPSYYGHFTHYRIEYPETGWLEEPIPQGTSVHLDRTFTASKLDEMPDQFVMLIETDWLGGHQLMGLRDAAAESSSWSVEIEDFEQRGFSNQVVLVSRRVEAGQ